MVNGASDKAKEWGWTMDVQAPASEGDFAAFVTTVQQLLEKGVKVMSINPIGTDSAVTAVKAANEKGVPIMAHNFITPFSEGKVETYVGYDQWGGAEKLAQYSCELIAKKYNTTADKTTGKVFILLGIDSIFSHRRTGGFKAGLTKYCPNVTIVGEQTGEWLRTKGSEVATIALQKDPDIDLFYGNSDEMAIGAALAAEQLGKTINKDFFAVGIDGNQPTLDLLKEGKFSATLGVDPYRMGVTVTEYMDKILKGETVPQIVLTPSVVVNPDNLQDYLDGKLWTEPVAGAPELDNDLPTVPEEATAPAGGAALEPPKDVYAGFVPPALTSPFHVAMVNGASDKAKEWGWTMDVQAPASEGDFAAFVTTVQQLLEKGVKVMSINPIGTDSAVTAVKAANEKGVPIMAHNFITPFSEGKVETYVGYDQWGGAEKLAQYSCELIAKKYNTTADKTTGKVFILLGIDSIFSHRRTGGFKAGLTKYCPNVTIVGEQTGEWLRTKGSEVATIALQKDPDIDLFYGNSDEMAIGAALAAEQLGKTINKDFFAVGIDGNQPTLDLLKEGKFSATLGVDPYRMGVTVTEYMARILNGETVPQIVLTPSVVVNPDNLQDYLDGKLWTEPVAGAPELDNDLPTVP